MLRKHLEAVPEPPAAHVEDLPVPLNDLIRRLLAKRPENRPADASTVYEALSILLADHAVTEAGSSILDVTQLGHSRSASGLFPRRARELRAEAERIAAEAEELKAEAIREAKRAVEVPGASFLVRCTEDIDAEIDRVAARSSSSAERQLSEEAYYQVFRQSINGSLPTPREFGDNVEAMYGISLPDLEAMRMVNRFSNRLTAELEEDRNA